MRFGVQGDLVVCLWSAVFAAPPVTTGKWASYNGQGSGAYGCMGHVGHTVVSCMRCSIVGPCGDRARVASVVCIPDGPLTLKCNTHTVEHLYGVGGGNHHRGTVKHGWRGKCIYMHRHSTGVYSVDLV